MYYIFVENDKLSGAGQCPCDNEEIQNIEVEQSIYDRYVEDIDCYIWNGSAIIENPDYEETKRQKERQRLDALTLTPSDVERALLAAKGMDFEDLKIYLKEEHGYTDLQIKAIGVELRAKDFYRGAEANGIRLFDTVGLLLGYTPDDMDYLFQNKTLPINNNNNNNNN